MKHALALYATGSITLRRRGSDPAKSNTSQELRLPSNTIPPITKREKASGAGWPTEFSAAGWAESAASMMQLCEDKVTDDDMVAIIRLAKAVSRAICYAKETESDSDTKDDEEVDDDD